MHILVLIKQVPETDKVKMDPQTGTMVRSGLESIVNPLDLYAIEEALVLKERYGAHITVLSMGPPDAERALRESLAMGCDSAILLTDKAFAGSDTWATSRVLAAAIRRAGEVDIILAGERATDGDTGQVGPAVAAWLDIPVLTYVSSLEIEAAPLSATTAARSAPLSENTPAATTSAPSPRAAPKAIRVRRLTEEGYQVLEARLPCLVTVVKEIASPRLPTLRGKKFARSAEIVRWGAGDLGLDPAGTGLAGSPTRVTKIFYPKVARNGQHIVAADEAGIEIAISHIVALFKNKGILDKTSAGDASSAPSVPLAAGPSSSFALERPFVGAEEQMPESAEATTKPEFWILAERRAGNLDVVSFELLARARALADSRGASLAAVVPTSFLSEEDAGALITHGADTVIALEHPFLRDFLSEPWAEVLFNLVRERKPEVFLAAATTTGRTLMPYLAAKLGTGLTADCTELAIEEGTGLLLQTRPAIGGNIMATIKTAHHKPQMATVRPHSMQPLSPDHERRGMVLRLAGGAFFVGKDSEPPVRLLALERNTEDFENLEGARVVVSGGRGLKKADNFKLIRELARTLGAVVGASREAVDRGWVSYPHQVGLSGKTISPEIYLAAGISGAIQHLAGIRTAKTIISINTDPEAPIHAVADLAIVGDLFEILPRLTARLRQRSIGAVPHEQFGPSSDGPVPATPTTTEQGTDTSKGAKL
jgi:electron transfer flavoprotein alpha subunit